MTSVPADLPAAPSREEDRACASLSRVVFMLAALFLWSLVLEAPLRYGLARLHLEALIYLPKLLMLTMVMLLPFLRPWVSRPALVLTLLAGLYLIWGLLNLPSPAQAAFGLWELVPLFFGLWASPLIPIEKWRRLFVLLFAVTAVGVLLNPMLHYPWSGQTLDVLGRNIEVSRQWESFGLTRFAGFTRISIIAAVLLLLFGTMLVVLLQHSSAKLFVWLVAGVGIALTTSKGPLGAWLLLSLYFAGGALLRWPRYWMRIWLFAATTAMLGMILMPLSSLWIHYDPTLHGYINKLLFASFGDRLNWMWPESLRLLDLGGAWHWWVGRGLGGIGMAQHYFEPAHFLAGDNLFVYLAVSVGLPLAILLFVGLWCLLVKMISQRDALAWRLPLVIILIAYGVVMSEMELPPLAFFGGLLFASLSIKKKPIVGSVTQ